MSHFHSIVDVKKLNPIKTGILIIRLTFLLTFLTAVPVELAARTSEVLGSSSTLGDTAWTTYSLSGTLHYLPRIHKRLERKMMKNHHS